LRREEGGGDRGVGELRDDKDVRRLDDAAPDLAMIDYYHIWTYML